jgi:C4-dicarboxylate-specific signal transduction histidine kinase
MQSSSIDLKRNAEAARYALLRRLAPAMRHDMAGGFQPVTMLATIVEKRLLAASPDLASLVKNSSDIRTLAIAATRSSLDLMGWMALDPNARVGLGQGIRDALHLFATELSSRGFKFINQTEGVTSEVGRDHLRGVFVAALLALTDAVAAASTANILLTAAQDGQDMLVTISLTDVGATSGAIAPHEEFLIGLAAYRNIDWDDVQAIADVDGLSVIHESGRVMLRLPIATSER